MMGYLKREREADERRLSVHRFRVRRWTEFGWHPHPDLDAKGQHAARKNRTDHLRRAAAIFTRKMQEQVPGFEPNVEVVRVNKEPELLFEITLLAIDEDDARKRAMYRFSRVLDTKIRDGFRPGAPLAPGWGRCEIARAKEPLAAA